MFHYFHARRTGSSWLSASVLYSPDEGWTMLGEAFLHCSELRVITDSNTIKHTSPTMMQKTPAFGIELMKSALSDATEILEDDAVTK
jgi:hypothetical protein